METEKWKNRTWLIKQIPKPQHESLENPEFNNTLVKKWDKHKRKLTTFNNRKTYPYPCTTFTGSAKDEYTWRSYSIYVRRV